MARPILLRSLLLRDRELVEVIETRSREQQLAIAMCPSSGTFEIAHPETLSGLGPVKFEQLKARGRLNAVIWPYSRLTGLLARGWVGRYTSNWAKGRLTTLSSLG